MRDIWLRGIHMGTETENVWKLQKQVETDVRSCCLMEIKQTEEKYTETLDSIEKVRFSFIIHSPYSQTHYNILAKSIMYLYNTTFILGPV